MKKIILGVIITAMVGWTVYDLFVSKQDTNQTTETSNANTDQIETTGLEVGDFAPEFELMTIEGETVRLSDYRGQRVFVNFWATWCPPCRAEMPDMQQLYEKQDVPVEILAINLTPTEQNEDNVVNFIADFGLTFPILMDINSEVAEKYQVQAYPTSYMIDSEGRISFVAPGAMNHELMVREVEKMK